MHRSSITRCFILAAVAVLFLCFSCWGDSAPKNVILLIGDGMGIGAITAARCSGPGRDGRLALDTMPVTGLVLT
ncbi:MAG: hypothetical protein QHI38_13400, partial [Armatimonadota bacterium]|nr:hypothetical protein [Armatimonadota bacterium]